ncbi:hypothetical protein O9993_12825 [Vibrio lentus]|nr:hypothetical protein [Vibrio lentus]
MCDHACLAGEKASIITIGGILVTHGADRVFCTGCLRSSYPNELLTLYSHRFLWYLRWCGLVQTLVKCVSMRLKHHKAVALMVTTIVKAHDLNQRV